MNTRKNFQCEHCLEPFYASTVVNAENAGEAECPLCGTTNIAWFDNAMVERKLPRDAYDIHAYN